ncbi:MULTISPECIES: hypothetical protein [Weeksellaceae]|uniref:hypothetical protein n=1 Tax=Weeksellaceae TaxID=2762318 RepID=UPI0016293C49|nr:MULTISPECIES: hypothetical protein [Weeksellaceae]MDE5432986.1 hypothetical protein [Elizabethkingia meningoseptica]HAY3553793.1 hypothetical protein [Elizabethkingia meningoseptica]
MSEFKGTPAPWTENISGDNASIDIILPNNTTISVDRQDRYNDEYVIERTEMEANAKLISKAPEMLEMLKKLTSLLNDIDSTLFHHNHSVNGWHLNGDSEPIMNFVAEMDMECLSEAEQLIKEATE